MDIGTTKHIGTNKEHFLEHEGENKGGQVFLIDACAAPTAGKGKVLLKLISRKSTFLTNVLYVSSMRSNLISSTLFNRPRIKLVFDSDKLALIKNGEFVRIFAVEFPLYGYHLQEHE